MLDVIRSFTPDIVLCDIKMPGMQGYELCERMKGNPFLKDTLFIAQTGLASSRASVVRSAPGSITIW